MVRNLGLLAMLLLGFRIVFAQVTPVADPHFPGVVLVSESTKTFVYDIKIKGMTVADQGRLLDSNLLSKQGVLAAHTDFDTKVCRVEVLKKVTEAYLQEVIRFTGLEIAKTFTE
jgi:hypothetical protein